MCLGRRSGSGFHADSIRVITLSKYPLGGSRLTDIVRIWLLAPSVIIGLIEIGGYSGCIASS
jgi:hypothetical protein